MTAHPRAVSATSSETGRWSGRTRPSHSSVLASEGEARDAHCHWVAAGALAGLLWALVQWFRRSHVAIYATFGMHAHSRLVMQTSEWAVLALTAGLWGWAIGTVGAIAIGAQPQVAATYVAAHTGLTLLLASVVVVLLGLRPTGTLLNALKDR